MLWSPGHLGRWVEKGPRPHPHTCPLPCRPPGHPVQNVLPSTTSMALLSKTFPSAKETCSPLWQSPRYVGTLGAYPVLSPPRFGSPAEGVDLRVCLVALSPGPKLVQSQKQGGP